MAEDGGKTSIPIRFRCGCFPVAMGGVMAMILSNEANHSILWMILHGICSWAYVLYKALGY